jgi:hypothetical protein
MVREDIERTSLYIQRDSFKLKEFTLYNKTTVTDIVNEAIKDWLKKHDLKKSQ